MVTTAFKRSQGLRLRPPSKLDRPVSPPKHPRLISRRRIFEQLTRKSRILQEMDSSNGGPLANTLHDLQHIFGDRLQAFVAYGPRHASPAPSVALVRTLTSDDLTACAARAGAWQRAGSATPLLLSGDEFAGSLDAFPIEYGEIIDTHRLLFGVDPFAGLAIRQDDLRRACEVQVKSHLLHLRENFVDCGGRPSAVAAMVTDSAPAFALLLRRLARLDGHAADNHTDLGAFAERRPRLDPRVIGDVLALTSGASSSGVDPARLFPAYLAAVEQLSRFIDTWQLA